MAPAFLLSTIDIAIMESDGCDSDGSMITKYNAKYYANLLTQKAVGGELATISQSLLSASVDINLAELEKRMIQTTSIDDIFFIAWNTL